MQQSMPGSQSLQGQLLIASPHIDDSRFDKTVILMCQHDQNSAMGLVLNKLAIELKLGDLYEKLDIGAPRFNAGNPVHIGGPVDSNRGFVLHSQDHMLPDSVPVTHDIGLTASIEILRDITDGVGPVHTLISLGCAGWSAGQLDQEMAENVWLNLPASPELVFETERPALWQQAFNQLGVDPAYYAGTSGNA
ncbi:YqgE/AlgH family protein [Alphaproteobacteria bacterium]|nr:YqgE/AlgH family protein [Alphaproteobacteria bacterium]